MYHHFVTIAPSDLTNRAYLRVENLIIIATEMHKQNLINYYLNRILKNIVSGSSMIILLKLNETSYLYDSILQFAFLQNASTVVCVISKFSPDNDRENLFLLFSLFSRNATTTQRKK